MARLARFPLVQNAKYTVMEHKEGMEELIAIQGLSPSLCARFGKEGLEVNLRTERSHAHATFA